MFVDASCWGPWHQHFRARGYRTLAPSWPAHGGTAGQARAAHPDAELAGLDLETVVEHYREIIAELEEPPILIGHSMGGLVVQRLLAEGLGSAGVAIDAAPPKGVFSLHPAFLKSNGRILRGSLDEPLDMDLGRFSYVFVNTMSEEQQRSIWERHARPESRRVGRDATKAPGRVDFEASRGPLLLIGGERDHAVPAVLGRKTWRRYRKADAYTEYREIEDADHWLIGGEKWPEVADLTLDWLAARGVQESSRSRAPRTAPVRPEAPAP